MNKKSKKTVIWTLFIIIISLIIIGVLLINKTRMEYYKKQISTLKQENNSYNYKITELKNQMSNLEITNVENEKKIEEYQIVISEYKNQIQTLSNGIVEKEKQLHNITALNQELASQNSEFQQ